MSENSTPTNRLAHSKSPYLLQHAHNPVDWFEWNDEAFQKARDEDKPIFLSVGYSTCHWCHVMERESFENDETAALMNENFVCIKVDREERPDVDKLYMTFVQMATRSGGWPMSVFLTPDLQPFYGGTYFPPSGAYGRPGFPDLLKGIARAWNEDRAGVVESAQSSAQTLVRYMDVGEPGDFEGGWNAVYDAAFSQIAGSFDEEWAGFGDAPKFPRPVQHDFLHAYAATFGNDEAHRVSFATLRAMAQRGMNDQLGGGFHRYSVDEEWIVSHFEKMLYDQAQLAISLLEAHQISGEMEFAEAAEKTLRYVWRDMTHLDGGFFAAEDADSAPRHGADYKEEGAFYVWKKSEIEAFLPQPHAQIFCDFYGVKSEGNAPKQGDPHGEFRGKNILFEAQSIQIVAKMNGVTVREALESLENSRQTLFEARQNRPRPHRDEKIIAFWNGLMISAFARAAHVLNNPKWLRCARSGADFVLRELFVEGELRRHFKDGAAPTPAFCDDYAALCRAFLDLYDASFETKWLEGAEKLADEMAAKFYDEERGGFYNSGLDPHVLVRFKEDYDGAEPSASALAIEVGARLFHLLGREDWREKAERSASAFAQRIAGVPSAMPLLLRSRMLLDAAPIHIVVAGEKAASEELLAAARQGFSLQKHLVLLDEKSREFWAQKQPFLREMREVDGQSAVYVCRDFACLRPVTTPQELRELL